MVSEWTQQVAVDLLDGVEAGHPLQVVVLEAVHVGLLAAVEQPGRLEGGGARAGVDGGVAEPLGAEQQQFVVAHEGLAVAAGRGGLGGQPHHEVDDADAVRAAVGEVAEEPQPRGARRTSCPRSR